MLNYLQFVENQLANSHRKLHHLFREHHGLLQRKQVVQAGLDAHILTRWVEAGRAERVQRGLYRLVEAEPFAHEALLEVSLRVPSGVICLRSALAFHGLGTGSPTAIDLAIPNKARTPILTYPPVRLYYFSPKVYLYGTVVHQAGPGTIKVYSPEKTLADLLYYRHKLGTDLFIEGLQDYIKRRPDLAKLLEAAKVRRVKPLLKTYLEPLL